MSLDKLKQTLSELQKNNTPTQTVWVEVKEVDWDEKTRTVTCHQGEKEIKLTIDQPIEGFDTPPTIVNGRTMVPIRYIAEFFEANVIWFPSSRTVIIVKNIIHTSQTKVLTVTVPSTLEEDGTPYGNK